ncbi:MAG: ABC transporter substrate-binding protein [Deltaproteobacteria bacterium]|jgi:phospholipid transport system substrate-binding protein|nr:ABC transporter substrate-binding protein [Deltaproteobacteria bacterium]MBW2518676.1 ABC transporter substrate-binding protein [Deltaproteobacteria bacterium]
MKKTYIGLGVLLLAISILLPYEVLAAGAKETVETQINKMLTKMQSPEFKGLDRSAKINEITTVINEIFDWQELSRRTLGREWKKFSPDQQKEFVNLFEKLLQDIYADRILAYTSEKIEFDKETELKKGLVEVESYIITADGKKVPLFYRLTDKSGQWRVYDVVIEGVSMVKNYRGQFREILSKKKPEDLLQTLREKTQG